MSLPIPAELVGSGTPLTGKPAGFYIYDDDKATVVVWDGSAQTTFYCSDAKIIADSAAANALRALASRPQDHTADAVAIIDAMTRYAEATHGRKA